MKKKNWALVCAILLMIICIFVIGYYCIKNAVPNESHSYSEDIDIQGNLYRVSDIETELVGLIEELEGKLVNLELSLAKYRFLSDGTGDVTFTFRFEGPGNHYSRFWERIMSQKLEGILALNVSLEEAKITFVNYSYGQIQGQTETPGLVAGKDLDIHSYIKDLMKDKGYLAAASKEPHCIEILLDHDNVSAITYSMDEKNILYTFP